MLNLGWDFGLPTETHPISIEIGKCQNQNDGYVNYFPNPNYSCKDDLLYNHFQYLDLGYRGDVLI